VGSTGRQTGEHCPQFRQFLSSQAPLEHDKKCSALSATFLYAKSPPGGGVRGGGLFSAQRKYVKTDRSCDYASIFFSSLEWGKTDSCWYSHG
jgi:hypothetical protein